MIVEYTRDDDRVAIKSFFCKLNLKQKSKRWVNQAQFCRWPSDFYTHLYNKIEKKKKLQKILQIFLSILSNDTVLCTLYFIECTIAILIWLLLLLLFYHWLKYHFFPFCPHTNQMEMISIFFKIIIGISNLI